MKKVSLLFAIALFAAVSFVSCGKDDGGGGGGMTVSGTIANAAGMDDFPLYGYYEDNFVAYENGNNPVPDISTTVHNGAFSLILRTPPTNMLHLIFDNIEGGVQISDPNVLMTAIRLVAKGQEICSVVPNDNPKTQQMMWTYVDNDVTITGNVDNEGMEYNYDIDLKKGWNKLFHIYSATSTIVTSNIPSNLVWMFSADIYNH